MKNKMKDNGLITLAADASMINTPQGTQGILWKNTTNGNTYLRNPDGTDELQYADGGSNHGTPGNVAVFDTNTQLVGPIADNPAGTGRTIVLTSPNGSQSGGPINIVAGNGGSKKGGPIDIQSGDGNTGTGNINIISGGITSSGIGGTITIRSGSIPSPNIGNGGDLSLSSGYSGEGNGGDVDIYGGEGKVNGGEVELRGGECDEGNGGEATVEGGEGGTNGGSVTIKPGIGHNGNAGNVNITGVDSDGGDGNGSSIILTPGLKNGTGLDGQINAPRIPVYDDDAAAGAGGLIAGDIYQITVTHLLAVKQ